MKIEMNMNYDKTQETSLETEYGEEILNAGWNPAVDLVCQARQYAVQDEKVEMPADLTNEIIDMFLRKMYAMQR